MKKTIKQLITIDNLNITDIQSDILKHPKTSRKLA